MPMSGIFPKFTSLRRGGANQTPESELDLELEEDYVPIQEQQHNSSSAPHITRYQTKVGEHGDIYNRNPIVTNNNRNPVVTNKTVFISSSPKVQDIVPKLRNLKIEYASEATRLKTFNSWPENSVVDKESLAKNGFIYLNVGDRVKCVFCCGVLSDWESGDIVANEHKTHCPECPFAFGYECGNIPLINNVAQLESRTVKAPADAIRNVSGSPQNQPRPFNATQYNTTVNVPLQHHPTHQTNTINIMPNAPAVNLTSDVTIRGEMNLASLQNQLQRNNTSSMLHHNVSDAKQYNMPTSLPPASLPGQYSMAMTQGPVLTNGPRYPAWADEKVRVRSFKGWPAQMTQTPMALAEAGLLYLGNGDRCKCFHCGGELYDWEPEDDPFEEHAKWFPRCGYLRQMKGTDFIQYVINRQNGLVLDSQTEEWMKRPHVQAVLSEGFTQEQVEEVFNRFGHNKLLDAPSIMKAIRQTQQEREVARNRMNAAVNPSNIASTSSASDTDVEMITEMSSKILSDIKKESPRPGSTTPVQSSSSDTSSVMEENEKLKEQKMCKICMDNDVCMMFLPCRHLVTCEHCSQSVTDCPMCRQPISDKLKVFWA